MAVTFVFVQVVLELPLGHQDVEVARLLEEAQVAHGDTAQGEMRALRNGCEREGGRGWVLLIDKGK